MAGKPTTRYFSTDLPRRNSWGRMATVRSRLSNGEYIVDMGDGLPQMANRPGDDPLVPGDERRAAWPQSSSTWHLDRLDGTASGFRYVPTFRPNDHVYQLGPGEATNYATSADIDLFTATSGNNRVASFFIHPADEKPTLTDYHAIWPSGTYDVHFEVNRCDAGLTYRVQILRWDLDQSDNLADFLDYGYTAAIVEIIGTSPPMSGTGLKSFAVFATPTVSYAGDYINTVIAFRILVDNPTGGNLGFRLAFVGQDPSNNWFGSPNTWIDTPFHFKMTEADAYIGKAYNSGPSHVSGTSYWATLMGCNAVVWASSGPVGNAEFMPDWEMVAAVPFSAAYAATPTESGATGATRAVYRDGVLHFVGLTADVEGGGDGLFRAYYFRYALGGTITSEVAVGETSLVALPSFEHYDLAVRGDGSVAFGFTMRHPTFNRLDAYWTARSATGVWTTPMDLSNQSVDAGDGADNDREPENNVMKAVLGAGDAVWFIFDRTFSTDAVSGLYARRLSSSNSLGGEILLVNSAVANTGLNTVTNNLRAHMSQTAVAVAGVIYVAYLDNRSYYGFAAPGHQGWSLLTFTDDASPTVSVGVPITLNSTTQAQSFGHGMLAYDSVNAVFHFVRMERGPSNTFALYRTKSPAWADGFTYETSVGSGSGTDTPALTTGVVDNGLVKLIRMGTNSVTPSVAQINLYMEIPLTD